MSLDVLTAIWKDPPCAGGDLLCLLAIADNADENGFAWPSVGTIARKSKMSERGARKCIRKLQEMGLISIEAGGGRNKTNAYQITTNGIGESADYKNPEQNTGTRVPPLEGINPEQRDINPEQSCTKPGTPVPPNSHEPSIEPSDISKSDFERFWIEVPRKEAKADAAKAFKAAVKKAPSETIISGMKRYAQIVSKAEKQYIKLPAGWLRAERWDDFAEPDQPQQMPKEQIERMLNSTSPAVREVAKKMMENSA